MKAFGYILIVFGILFVIIETVYFGGNLFPSSRNEFMCDMISLGCVVGGSLIVKTENNEI
jgi:hypothetical protein